MVKAADSHVVARDPITAPWGVVKRAVDVVGAAALLTVTMPLLIVAMMAVRFETSGPAIFRQVRVGKRGQHFTLLKLRTMVAGNDESEHASYVAALMEGTAPRSESGIYKLDNDPRITRVGRVLRRSSIDELPQLWNVLRGEMSLIGPRPPLPREVERYDDRAWLRLAGRPGITGLWQVSGRCELTFGEQIALDVEYWERWSPLLDLQILARTPGAIFSARGAA